MEITNEILNAAIESSLNDGTDKYVVINNDNKYEFKTFNEIHKSDTVHYKIVLTWRDNHLDYKLIEYSEPFKIVKKILNTRYNEHDLYLCIYLVNSHLYTFNNIENRKRFKNMDDLINYYDSCSYYNKKDREYILGLI